MRSGGRLRISITTAAERTNVSASIRNAVPTPKAAIRTPPSAGPAKRIPSGSISSRSALACSSSSRGTTSGTIAVNAGWNSACPSPYTTTSSTTGHSRSVSANASAEIAPIATNRIRSAITSRRRRSKRSLRTPASNRPATCGSVQANPTIASALGSFEMS